MNTKVDILAFGAHPDDVELSAGGTIAKHVSMGMSCVLVDLTQGELGTRGTAETRKIEAENAAKILQLSGRECLNFPDGFITVNQENILKVIQVIRKYQPKIVLANAPNDRHTDHSKAAQLVKEACFLSGLQKIQTFLDGETQVPHRPENLFHYIQDYYLEPSFLVDISAHFSKKMESVLAYSTQFYQEGEQNNSPNTPISGKDFQQFLEARARVFGRRIQVEFAEGFITAQTVGIKSFQDLL